MRRQQKAVHFQEARKLISFNVFSPQHVIISNKKGTAFLSRKHKLKLKQRENCVRGKRKVQTGICYLGIASSFATKTQTMKIFYRQQSVIHNVLLCWSRNKLESVKNNIKLVSPIN